MSEVLTGRGPQPPQVYWIRRGLVALVGLVLIGLVVWAFAPKGGPTTAVPAGSTSPVASEPAPSPSASPTGSPEPSASGSTAPTASTATTAPTACEPIGVQLELKGFNSVKADGKQTFVTTVENNTALPCVMEITKDSFVLRVVSGSDSIWSTAHCEKWLPEVKKQTLKAGASVEVKVTWELYRSSADCTKNKGALGAGTYIATAAYKESSTARLPFTITK